MIPYNPDNLKFARKNRKQRNATKQEGILWHTYLKNASFHFYRQYRVGDYILDFYCPKKHLAIELDGGQHYEDAAIAYDSKRTEFLNQQWITVLRYTNDEIDKTLYAVIDSIRKRIGEG